MRDNHHAIISKRHTLLAKNSLPNNQYIVVRFLFFNFLDSRKPPPNKISFLNCQVLIQSISNFLQETFEKDPPGGGGGGGGGGGKKKKKEKKLFLPYVRLCIPVPVVGRSRKSIPELIKVLYPDDRLTPSFKMENRKNELYKHL